MSDENYHQCPKAGDSSIVEFSEICTNGSNTTSYECIQDDEGIPLVLRYIQGVWFLIIFIVGSFGNLTTIIAIPLAINKKISGFEQAYSITNFFILHLSIVELCHCVTYTLATSISMIMQAWHLGTTWCIVTGASSMITYYLELISLNLIGISRCVLIKTKNILWFKYAYLLATLVVILWIPCFMLLFPSFTGIMFGWFCYAGACDFYIPIDKPHAIIFNVFTITAIVLMCASYSVIWLEVRKSRNTVRLHCHGTLNKDSKNDKMTRIIVSLLLLSIICNLPAITFHLVLSKLSNNIYVYHILNMLYETQFAMNFFIYVLTNDNYRNAYKSVWNQLTFKRRLSIHITSIEFKPIDEHQQ